MSSLLNMLFSQLGTDQISQISDKLGMDPKTTSSALSAVLPSLVMALAKNSSTPQGAESLSNALTKDHDGSVLDDIPSFLDQHESGQGAGMLQHILGDKRTNVESGLSKATGMDASSLASLMEMAAPLVLGMLGKMQREKNLDASSLSNLLTNEHQHLQQNAPQHTSLLTQLLDANKDGDATDDVLKLGMGLLGKLFQK